MRTSRLLLGVLAPLLLCAGSAQAAWTGGAGPILYQDSFSQFDPLSNGATEYRYSLAAFAPGASHAASALECQGSDAGFVGATQYCPESTVAFSQDGTELVTAGVEYQSDGTAEPAQPPCTNGDRCPQALIVAAADGSSPRLVQTGLADAEHPAFLTGSHDIVFAGRTTITGEPNLYVSDGVSGDVASALTRSGADDPAPCHNGNILYVHRGDIYLMHSNSSLIRRLTFRGGASSADCAHDGRAFVFLRRATLYTENTDGRHLRRLGTPGVVVGTPALSPAGGRVAIATERVCTSACGARYPQCTHVVDRIEVLDLRGRRRASHVIGGNACSSDGNLGGDAIGGVAWQPSPGYG